MFIRRSRAHPLTALPTPVARRKFIKENLLVICIPRAGTTVWEMLPPRSALVGKMREGGVSVEVVDESDPSLQSYTARLRQAALSYVADPANTHLIELLHTEIEIVGRYDATLRRVERIDRLDSLAAWLDPEPLPPDPRDAGPEYLIRLWEEVVPALALPASLDASATRRAIKQVAFLAEDYEASGLTRGADELGLLAMWLETQQAPPTADPQPKKE